MSRYIDADYVNAFPIRIDHYDEEHGNRHFVLGIESVMEYIEEAPSIDIEPKRGEWIDMGDFEQCSVCKGTHLKEFQSYYGKTTWIKTPYCPNCGADMREREGE